jgi:transposase
MLSAPPVLHVLEEQKRKTSEALNYLLKEAAEDASRPEHATIRVLRSLPGIGVMVATTWISEANGALINLDYDRLRCYAGVAPVTKQSGKSRRVLIRHGCNLSIQTTRIDL